MKKIKHLLLALVFAAAVSSSVFAAGEISDYTEERVKEFLDLRIVMKGAEDQNAVETLTAARDKALEGLEENALDLQQEKCILESFYFMELYEHFLSLYPDQHGDFRKQMKILMKSNIACAEDRKMENISKWLYVVCGDVTSYYMTRSVAATLLHGFSVKGYYEKSIEKDPYISQGNVSLGN